MVKSGWGGNWGFPPWLFSVGGNSPTRRIDHPWGEEDCKKIFPLMGTNIFSESKMSNLWLNVSSSENPSWGAQGKEIIYGRLALGFPRPLSKILYPPWLYIVSNNHLQPWKSNFFKESNINWNCCMDVSIYGCMESRKESSRITFR